MQREPELSNKRQPFISCWRLSAAGRVVTSSQRSQQQKLFSCGPERHGSKERCDAKCPTGTGKDSSLFGASSLAGTPAEKLLGRGSARPRVIRIVTTSGLLPQRWPLLDFWDQLLLVSHWKILQYRHASTRQIKLLLDMQGSSEGSIPANSAAEMPRAAATPPSNKGPGPGREVPTRTSHRG